MVKDDDLGTIKFSDESIIICAVDAIARTLGAHTIGPNLKGIKVSQENNALKLDVDINIEFGYKIPEVAWNVQENIKDEIMEITGLKVNSVEIRVKGVYKNTITEE